MGIERVGDMLKYRNKREAFQANLKVGWQKGGLRSLFKASWNPKPINIKVAVVTTKHIWTETLESENIIDLHRDHS